jgi:endonuclease YncB( thermonuclease family)
VRTKGILKALFILTMLPVPNLALAEIMGVASVVDGDTIEISDTRIRFYGIDAPEIGQTCSIDGDVYSISSDTYRCGQQAALALADRIGRDPIYCDERDTDRYGRVVAVCWLNDEDLSAWMVQEGWARAYRQYSRDYVPQEEIAERERRGIWRGDFIDPWDWRKGQRLGTGQADDDLASSGRTLAVKVNAANVRATPSRNSRLVTTIRRGETVEEIGDAGDWYQIRLKSGLSGWIFADLLGPTDAPK